MTAKKTIITLGSLLALSLSANAFLGGMMVAHGPLPPPPFMMMDDEMPPPDAAKAPEGQPGAEATDQRGPGRDFGQRGGRGGGDRGPLGFMRQLPEDVREPLMTALKNDRENMRSRMESMRSSHQELATLTKAEPFDEAKVRAQLEKMRGEQSAVQAHVHDILLKAIAGMTPEQRAKLADSAQKIFR